MKHSLKQVFPKFMKEDTYRVEVTLCLNLAINFVYAIFNAICGLVFHSAWIGTLAFYYILLSVMRLLLVKGIGQVDLRRRWKKYCQCG